MMSCCSSTTSAAPSRIQSHARSRTRPIRPARSATNTALHKFSCVKLSGEPVCSPHVLHASTITQSIVCIIYRLCNSAHIIYTSIVVCQSGHLIGMRTSMVQEGTNRAPPPSPPRLGSGSTPAPPCPFPREALVRRLLHISPFAIAAARQNPAYLACEEKISRSERRPIRSHPSSAL